MKKQLREKALIDSIVRGANFHFWHQLAVLIGVPVPVTYAEKVKLIKKIKGRFE